MLWLYSPIPSSKVYDIFMNLGSLDLEFFWMGPTLRVYHLSSSFWIFLFKTFFIFIIFYFIKTFPYFFFWKFISWKKNIYKSFFSKNLSLKIFFFAKKFLSWIIFLCKILFENSTSKKIIKVFTNHFFFKLFFIFFFFLKIQL